MENKPLLTFSLDGLLYGIDALLVQEIFYLPELTPILEAPDGIVGLLNLRGILPVMHLALRLRQDIPECNLSDNLIVLAWEGSQIGILVNSVNEVKSISPEFIETKIFSGQKEDSSSRFIAGIAKVDADIIVLLDSEKLLSHSEEFDLLEVEKTYDDSIYEYGNDRALINKKTQEKSNIVANFYAHCCPNATLAEKAIFQ